MKNFNLPSEIKEVLPSIKLSEKICMLLWKKNNYFLKVDSLEYDLNLIEDYLMNNESNTIEQIDKNMPMLFHKSISGLHNELTYFFDNIFDITDNIEGDDYVNEEIVKKIGVNSNMRIKNKHYYTYAACHHCYSLVNVIPSKYTIYSPCYRKETGHDKYRKESFHMFEVVEFDKEEILDRQRLFYIYIMTKLLKMHGISDIRVVIANDSFVTDNKEKIVYQMLNKSKIEIQALSKDLGRYIAIASINMHYKEFIQKFDISCSFEHNSMCFGIGLERLMEILLENEH